MLDTLFITDCIAFNYQAEHKNKVILWKRARSNTIIKYLTLGEEFRNNFNNKCGIIKAEYSLDSALIPQFNPKEIKCLLFSALMDDVQTTYNVDGYSLSPEATTSINPNWDSFLKKYKKEDPIPPSKVVENYIEIAKYFPNANKGLILHPPFRLDDSNKFWSDRIKEITIACLHNLDLNEWKLFPIPQNVPPAKDNYWVHYDQDWNFNFISNCVSKLSV